MRRQHQTLRRLLTTVARPSTKSAKQKPSRPPKPPPPPPRPPAPGQLSAMAARLCHLHLRDPRTTTIHIQPGIDQNTWAAGDLPIIADNMIHTAHLFNPKMMHRNNSACVKNVHWNNPPLERTNTQAPYSAMVAFARLLAVHPHLEKFVIANTPLRRNDVQALAFGLAFSRPNFQALELTGNFLTEECMDVFCDTWLRLGLGKHRRDPQNNPKNLLLRSLTLQRNEVGDAGVSAIASLLQSGNTNTSSNEMIGGGLEELIVRECQITDQGALQIANALAVHARPNVANPWKTTNPLLSLDLAQNNIGNKGAIALADILKTTSPTTTTDSTSTTPTMGTALLKKLNLSQNPIGNEGFVAIGRVLQEHNTSLELLNLSKCNTNTTSVKDTDDITGGIQAIANVFQENEQSRLAVLILNGVDGLDDAAVAVLVDGLLSGAAKHRTCPLITLSLNQNKIGPDGARKLANLLLLQNDGNNDSNNDNSSDSKDDSKDNSSNSKDNSSTDKSNVDGNNNNSKNSSNSNNDKSPDAPLRPPPQLEYLQLSHNHVGDEGAKALAEPLRLNKPLLSLQLQSNTITDDGIRALAQALATNQYLQVLSLDGNDFTDAGMEALAEVLGTKNNTLRHLFLGQNGITAEGAKALADALVVNTGLEQIKLQYNRIGDEGARALIGCLGMNRTLKQLDLQYNLIGMKGADALRDAKDADGNPVTGVRLFDSGISDRIMREPPRASKYYEQVNGSSSSSSSAAPVADEVVAQ